jgi:hypothetical protein
MIQINSSMQKKGDFRASSIVTGENTAVTQKQVNYLQ